MRPVFTVYRFAAEFRKILGASATPESIPKRASGELLSGYRLFFSNRFFQLSA